MLVFKAIENKNVNLLRFDISRYYNKSDEKTADENNISLDVREAITDILLKKVISGDISAEKVSEIDELLFS